MNHLVQPHKPVAELAQRLVLHGVSWQTYEKVLDLFGDRPLRITYDRGSLELMSPLSLHEVCKRCIGLLMGVLDSELRIPLKGVASTTFRRHEQDHGLEADECFYVGDLTRVHDWNAIDLVVDPPPDLAIEIDITSSCLNRLAIYAGLGVPEVWRFDGADWHIHCRRDDRSYEIRSQSLVLPFIELSEITAIMERYAAGLSDGELMAELFRWVRESVRPRWSAWTMEREPSAENP